MPTLDTPTRRLTLRYIAGLVAIALLAVAGILLIEGSLGRYERDAHVVNVAGFQRARGLRLVVAARSLRDAQNADEAAHWRGVLRETLAEFTATQAALQAGDPERGLPGELPPELSARFADVDADFQAVRVAALELIARTEQYPATQIAGPIAVLVHRQEAFLAGMEEVVDALDGLALARVQGLRRLGYGVLAAVLLALLLQGLFVLRPAVRRLSEELSRQHRLQRQLLDAVTAEQHRIGSDLHDGLLQQLTGLSLLIRSLVTRTSRGAVVEPGHLAQLGDLLDQAIAEARRMSRAMMPVVLEQKGLAFALEDLVRNAALTGTARCTSRIELRGRLPEPSKANHLFRIAQEAVNNALKHGHAENVVVELVDEGDAIELRIRDDGVGIATPDSAPRLGMGLRTMEYRARAIGAVLRLEPVRPHGTLVRCRLPDARFSTGGAEPMLPVRNL